MAAAHTRQGLLNTISPTLVEIKDSGYTNLSRHMEKLNFTDRSTQENFVLI